MLILSDNELHLKEYGPPFSVSVYCWTRSLKENVISSNKNKILAAKIYSIYTKISDYTIVI